jgi:4-diphosphocytidyl-2-C-methyl-D-erythritol kinase
MSQGAKDEVLRGMRAERDLRHIESWGDKFRAYGPAKLNATLKIGVRDGAGMHYIESTMQSIGGPRALFNTMTLTRGTLGSGGRILSSGISSNVRRALAELARETGERLDCTVTMERRIPEAVGLGSSSTDPATALRLANFAFGFGLNLAELERVARQVGNDVPFMLFGGRASVEGSFEHRITRIDHPWRVYLVAVPLVQFSTREMYAALDAARDSGAQLNGFTELVCERSPEAAKLLEVFRGAAEESGVTGKGPAVFAEFRDFSDAREMKREVSAWFGGRQYLVKPVGELEI